MVLSAVRMLRAEPSMAASSSRVSGRGALLHQRCEDRPRVDLAHDRPGKVQSAHHQVVARRDHGAPPQVRGHGQLGGDVAVPGQILGQAPAGPVSRSASLAHDSSTGLDVDHAGSPVSAIAVDQAHDGASEASSRSRKSERRCTPRLSSRIAAERIK